MGVRVSRPLTYSDRFGKQQSASGGLFQLHQITFADRAIQGDPIRALVELITNCDDAYNKRPPQLGGESCPIEISVREGEGAPYLTIRDRAVGMDGPRMDEALGSYTSATSTGADRGYFGRGLKDGILALGDGEVTSVTDGVAHRAWLGIRGGAPYYEAHHPTPARDGASPQSGTTVRIHVNRPDVAPPTYRNLERQIPFHFMLRGILSNPARQVYLSEVSPAGETIRRKRLSYRYPDGKLVLDNSLLLNRFEIPYRVVVYESERGLSTPRDAGPYAEAGLLITDGNAILDVTLGMFGADPDANALFGRLECPHLNTLMRANEPIVQATRHGLMWDHEFARELRLTLDERLEPLVRNRAREAASLRRARGASATNERLERAVAALNEIAREECGERAPTFTHILFADAGADAPRANYDADSESVTLNVGHPAVAPYMADAERRGVPSAQGQALLAEFVLQAACAAIAERNGAPAVAARLRDTHAERVHAALVEERFRQADLT